MAVLQEFPYKWEKSGETTADASSAVTTDSLMG